MAGIVHEAAKAGVGLQPAAARQVDGARRDVVDRGTAIVVQRRDLLARLPGANGRFGNGRFVGASVRWFWRSRSGSNCRRLASSRSAVATLASNDGGQSSAAVRRLSKAESKRLPKEGRPSSRAAKRSSNGAFNDLPGSPTQQSSSACPDPLPEASSRTCGSSWTCGSRLASRTRSPGSSDPSGVREPENVRVNCPENGNARTRQCGVRRTRQRPCRFENEPQTHRDDSQRNRRIPRRANTSPTRTTSPLALPRPTATCVP